MKKITLILSIVFAAASLQAQTYNSKKRSGSVMGHRAVTLKTESKIEIKEDDSKINVFLITPGVEFKLKIKSKSLKKGVIHYSCTDNNSKECLFIHNKSKNKMELHNSNTSVYTFHLSK